MGFGLLFIGYFMANLMSIHKFGAFVSLAGYIIVLVASCKLVKYNKNFGFLQLGAILMIAVHALVSAADVGDFLYSEMIISRNVFTDGFDNIIANVETAADFIFSAAMLWSIRAIAIETEVDKIAFGAVRNFVFICVYNILLLVGKLPFPFVEGYISAFGPTVLVLYFVLIVLNLVVICSCYARICDESDVDMEQKPSRFAFVNRFREESAKRREQAIRENEEYLAQKRAKQGKKKK